MIRVIATLLWNGSTLVKGVGFDAWRPVGHPLQAINVYQMREVDEIIFLDITATREGRRPDFRLIESLARDCHVPLTVGGGVRTVDDVRDLLRAGADKVSIQTARNVIEESGAVVGRQAIVGVVEHGDVVASLAPTHAGEVLLQSRLLDGTMRGYDVPAITAWSLLDAPVIASGGCGTYEHMAQAIEAGASAVAAGAMWLFTEQTPLEAKRYLHAKGVAVRL
ncbi:MAG: hypothetical protein A2W26_03570 [Acidobacteria bacterium RBG_16_64_8]|nr:MAG: hypothetical protein A2W26_03570 [Acidobacteria bacterium RBG_16_64_8]